MIRAVELTDAAAISAIYNDYIEQTSVTFEVVPVSAADIAERIQQCNKDGLPWLVAEVDQQIAGYCYASPWKGRCAYAHSVEITVYLQQCFFRQGIGRQLYVALFAKLREQKVHTVIAGIALPNPASIALHESLGLKQVAEFSQVGRKFDQWVDVGYWQKIFVER
ncbi:MAG: N-acetyltransferase family protein [Gammaproteobacteria bacterium]|nr:N-acetyltransferase family protein [Gammaproteobacteria bacterium]